MRRAVVIVAGLVAAFGVAWLLTDRQGDSRLPRTSQRLNVLLITIDTLRADRVGRGLTPNIDALAARGVSFPNVRATVPLTLPSHVSLMTGTIPPAHGVRENGVIFDRKTPTLARIFKDAGYRTGAFVGAFVLNRRFGLDEGFDTYDDAVRRNAERAELLEAERPGVEVIDAAIGWLKAAPAGQPFFLWTHLYDPHAPYTPPAEFLAKAAGNGYDGEVAYADAQVGRLLAALSDVGATGQTVVVVTSDHGESLGEHGEPTHGMLLYDGALRVPVVASRAMGPQCHQDLAPELLRAAGLADAIPPSMLSEGHGVVRGNGGRQLSNMPFGCTAYAETLYPRRAGWHALRALSDEHRKLILSSEQELFDLRSDAPEARNVAREQPGVVQGMAAVIEELSASASKPAAVAPEAAERLRALGYVSGSSAVTSDDRNAPNPARVIAAWEEFERALGLLHGDQAREAVTILKRLSTNHPGAPVFMSTYAQALRQSGDAAGAVRAYRSAVARWPGDPALFHDLAVAAREAGDPREAMKAEQAALALDENSAMAHNGMGLLHADAGRFSEAVVSFERATRHDPANASYWTNLGNARAASDDRTGAASAYLKALEVDPAFADALNGLGTVFVQQGKAGEAISLFERAVKQDPELYAAILNLGIAFQESGQRDRAATIYREILARAPASAAREREAAGALLKELR